MADKMQKIVSLAKRRGFIFQSSEIYGGVEALWDYGPLGSLLKNNIRNLWLKRFVQDRDDVVLIDGTVIMHPKTWEASGHLESFSDPLIECKECHSRFRQDQLKKKICPQCGSKEFTSPRQFNLMFKTFLGPVENEASTAYLRPESAQSMFTNFKLVQESQRLKVPFGIAQIGRCFRNEITTGNFTFRSKEFDIAEIEYFVEPGKDEKQFEFWLDQWQKFFLELGLRKANLRLKEHPKSSLSHYSKRTVDIEYKFPWGFAELAGVANRTDYDLKRHSQYSGQDLQYYDEEKRKKYFPYVIEPTLGLERAILAVLCDAYTEVKGGRTKTTEAVKDMEVVLRINKKIAPIQVAILPLVKNKPELVKKSKEIANSLKKYFMVRYDEVGSIGRRYRRMDEVGCPFAITVDFETLEKDDVTLRDRDTMKQKRVKVKDLAECLEKLLSKTD